MATRIDPLADIKNLFEHPLNKGTKQLEILTIAALYRDRADCENAFDELENHWGWGGLTTPDLERCRRKSSMRPERKS
jgi:hypothetical protein